MAFPFLFFLLPSHVSHLYTSQGLYRKKGSLLFLLLPVQVLRGHARHLDLFASHASHRA